MDLAKFKTLSKQEASLAYRFLYKALKPVFSGSVDHRVNLLDHRKVIMMLEKGGKLLEGVKEMELKLMNELKDNINELYERKMN